LLARGLLLLNDGIYWDDWLLYRHLQGHDWQTIDALVHEAGMTPVNSAFLHLFAYVPGGVFSFKLTVFLLIVAVAWLVYLIGVQVGLNRLTAWCVAALQMVFPGFQDSVVLATKVGSPMGDGRLVFGLVTGTLVFGLAGRARICQLRFRVGSELGNGRLHRGDGNRSVRRVARPAPGSIDRAREAARSDRGQDPRPRSAGHARRPASRAGLDGRGDRRP